MPDARWNKRSIGKIILVLGPTAICLISELEPIFLIVWIRFECLGFSIVAVHVVKMLMMHFELQSGPLTYVIPYVIEEIVDS